MLLNNSIFLWVIVLCLVRNISCVPNERKRMFKFINVTTIHTYSNRNNVGQPISTTSSSVVSCATHLMQNGPFTCLDYYTLQGICRSNNGGETAISLNSKMNAGWSFYHVQSIGNSPQECKMTDHGIEYRGRTNVTLSGIPCQRWGATYPHDFYDSILDDLISIEGDPGVSATNYCRNPDDIADGPWCYTMDPNVRWEVCDVPKCQCYNFYEYGAAG